MTTKIYCAISLCFISIFTISKKYWQAPPKALVTFPEAVMQQHNDVEKAMNKLFLLIVKCHTCETTNHIKETGHLF